MLLYEQGAWPVNPRLFLLQVMGEPKDKEEVNLFVENRKLREKVGELTTQIDQMQKEVITWKEFHH